MAKVTFNKYHDKWEVYFHRKGKNHVGYYPFFTMAIKVAEGVNRALEMTA